MAGRIVGAVDGTKNGGDLLENDEACSIVEVYPEDGFVSNYFLTESKTC